MDEEFALIIASDEGHDEVFCELYCGDLFVAIVSQENGLGSLRVEFPNSAVDQSLVATSVDMEGLIQALRAAADKLAE